MWYGVFPTSGVRMLASVLAALHIMVPVLDTKALLENRKDSERYLTLDVLL